ncbi:hypothetical protein D9M68_689160 [compost metagenome]
MVADDGIAARAGVVDEPVHFLRRHAAVFVQAAGIALDDAARDVVGQRGQQGHAAGPHAQRLTLARVSGQDLHGVTADLAMQADRIVIVAHHQEHGVARAVGQAAQHGQQLAHARVARTRVWVHRQLGTVFLGAGHGQDQAGIQQGGQQTVDGGALYARQARDIGHAEAIGTLVPQGGQDGQSTPQCAWACGRGIAVLHANL